MKTARHLAGIATGLFLGLGIMPAHAIEVGQKRHIDIVRDDMKDWDLVSASRVGPAAGASAGNKKDGDQPSFPGSPLLKAADAREGAAPAKAAVKLAPLVLIFNHLCRAANRRNPCRNADLWRGRRSNPPRRFWCL